MLDSTLVQSHEWFESGSSPSLNFEIRYSFYIFNAYYILLLCFSLLRNIHP